MVTNLPRLKQVRARTRVPCTSITFAHIQIRAGFDHTLFLSTDGQAFACGWSGDGQTGNGSGQVKGTSYLFFFFFCRGWSL